MEHSRDHLRAAHLAGSTPNAVDDAVLELGTALLIKNSGADSR